MLWLTLSVGVFVLLGSLGLLAAWRWQMGREEASAFAAKVEANAAFLGKTPLPQTPQMADQLGEITSTRVFFRQKGKLVGKPDDPGETALESLPADGRPHWVGNHLVAGRTLPGGSEVFFLRPENEATDLTDRPEVWVALGAFWVLSVALGIWLARRVARPLQRLAETLPAVGGDEPLPALPTERADEIGHLARALVEAHSSLHEERARRRAAEQLAAHGRMATSLAHEVRNPVAAIRLHAQLLEGAPPAEAATSRRLIESEAARIEALVEQWMRYARPPSPRRQPLDLREAAREAARVVAPQARHAQARLVVEDGPPVPAEADAGQIRQILLNLLGNALQALPEGGTVRVAVRAVADRALLAVEDSGPGFTGEALARFAEPFFSTKEAGLGLGLAMSQALCLAHGGTLGAANLPQGGARVEMSIPVREPGPRPVPSRP